MCGRCPHGRHDAAVFRPGTGCEAPFTWPTRTATKSPSSISTGSRHPDRHGRADWRRQPLGNQFRNSPLKYRASSRDTDTQPRSIHEEDAMAKASTGRVAPAKVKAAPPGRRAQDGEGRGGRVPKKKAAGKKSRRAPRQRWRPRRRRPASAKTTPQEAAAKGKASASKKAVPVQKAAGGQEGGRHRRRPPPPKPPPRPGAPRRPWR